MATAYHAQENKTSGPNPDKKVPPALASCLIS